MSQNTISDYHALEKLGRGSFAQVYRAVHKITNHEVAIKEISQDKLTLKLQENLESEISILRNHAHKNIVKLYDIKRTDRYIFIILEYCKGGDLQHFIKNQPNGRLSEASARHFMSDLGAGLKFLNDRNLVHRDIKPQNLLLTENSLDATLKIADFGFARHLEETSLADTLCGSPLYMAPEILSQHQYNAKADLWSVGAVLFEMLAGKPPFTAMSQVDLMRVIQKPLQVPKDVVLSRECFLLLQRLLKRDPLERISFEEFFRDSFVNMKPEGAEAMETKATLGVENTTDRAASPAEGSSSHYASVLYTADSVPTSPQAPPSPSTLQCGPMAFLPHTPIPRSRKQQLPPSSTSSCTLSNNTTTTAANDIVLHAQDSAGSFASPMAFTCSLSSIPFHQSIPSPRVNPFKPLEASPPGAIALASNSGSSNRGGGSRKGSIHYLQETSNHSSGGGGGGGSTESDGFVLIDSCDHWPSPRNQTQQGSLGGTNSYKGNGGYSSSSSSSTPRFNDSCEGAVKTLSYMEGCKKRIMTIASLGDAKAIVALTMERQGIPFEGGTEEDAYGRSGSNAGKGGVLGAVAGGGGGNMPVNLLVEALVLYLKALSVVRHSIKATRQVGDILKPYLKGAGASSAGRSFEERKELSTGAFGGGVSSSSSSSSSISLSCRVHSLLQWLEQQFNVVLERAEQCQEKIAASGSGTGSSSGTNPTLLLAYTAEEILYNHALSLAKDAAIKEVLGKWERAWELYDQAKGTIEALLGEPTLSVDDQRKLEGYAREFSQRIEEVTKAAEESRT